MPEFVLHRQKINYRNNPYRLSDVKLEDKKEGAYSGENILYTVRATNLKRNSGEVQYWKSGRTEILSERENEVIGTLEALSGFTTGGLVLFSADTLIDEPEILTEDVRPILERLQFRYNPKSIEKEFIIGRIVHTREL
jgi:hypothetical protein